MSAVLGTTDDLSSRFKVKRIGGYRAAASRDAFMNHAALNYADAFNALSEPHL